MTVKAPMKTFDYTYVVVRYVHDPAAGESLNVGVVLYAPTARYLKAEFSHTYERLSNAFVDFDGDHFKRAVRRFEASLAQQAQRWTEGLFAGTDLPADAGVIAKGLWPDPEMSFRYGEILAGVSDDLGKSLASLYDRMVTSQYETTVSQRRTDEEVWAVYNKVFMRSAISRNLQEYTFHAASFEVKFEHSFKNGAWHALQPLSLDYSEPKGIQTKVVKWLGTTVMLEDNQDLGTLYLLLGPPKTPAHQDAYQKAKELLAKRIKVSHRIVEENQAEEFAQELVGIMKKHGLLDAEAKG